MTFKAFTPTDEQRKIVRNASIAGLGQEVIGKLIGINDDTLRKYFRKELDEGVDDLKQKAAGYLWEKIEKGDTTALIFFLKTRCGFAEKRDVNLANQPGTTLKTSLDVSNLTDDQLKAIAAIKLNGE